MSRNIIDFIVPDKFCFHKLDNGNVLLSKLSNSQVVASFPPNQIITKDIASTNNIILKSALTNDRGMVINCNDISWGDCYPVINFYSIDSAIWDLSTLFFFEVRGGLQHITFNRTLTPFNDDVDKYFCSDGLSNNLEKAFYRDDLISVFTDPSACQSNVLFIASKKTKLISYTGTVRKLGFELMIYKAKVDVIYGGFVFDTLRLIAGLPMTQYQEKFDLQQFEDSKIEENEIVLVTYKSPVGANIESFFWFNGTFAIQ